MHRREESREKVGRVVASRQSTVDRLDWTHSTVSFALRSDRQFSFSIETAPLTNERERERGEEKGEIKKRGASFTQAVFRERSSGRGYREQQPFHKSLNPSAKQGGTEPLQVAPPAGPCFSRDSHEL